MKTLTVAGIVLAAHRAFKRMKGINYGSERSALTVADLQSAEAQRAFPPWVGWAAVVGGVALMGARHGALRLARRERSAPAPGAVESVNLCKIG